MKTFHDLSPSAHHWTAAAVAWSDGHYDSACALLSVPQDADMEHPPRYDHMVRDSAWYAVGLLMRQREGDVERAQQIIRAVLRYQYDEPGRVYHGTFRRAPKEPNPPPDHAVEWKDYDPNWREFICCIFIVLGQEFKALLPDDLLHSMEESIRKAAEGAFARRVAPNYTNIALMSALLLDHAGQRFGVTEWRAQGTVLARAIYTQFEANQCTFSEYNSPTYYGVDLFALALWRLYGLSESIFRTPGAVMEAELWRDIGCFYHAGLRNLCGPYDRSYGMDLTHYLGVVALWIALVVPVEQAPMPDVSGVFGHSADFYFMPPIALLGAQVPADVLPHLVLFQGERQRERQVEPGRIVTAWLRDDVMIGASRAHPIRSGDSQFYGATMHWRTPDGAVGWLRVRTTGPVDARVDHGVLTIDSIYPTTLRFELRVAGIHAQMIQVAQWTLPGLILTVDAGGAVPETSVANGQAEVQLQVEHRCKLAIC